MPVVPKIKGGISNVQKEKEEKYKKSNFHLTISTNKKYEKDDPHLEDDMKYFDQIISDILNHIDGYVKLPEHTEWNDTTIKDVDVDYVVEVGSQKNGKRLHCHILFRFLHRTKIQLDYDKIKKRICDALQINNVYMYNRLVRPTEGQNIMAYLSKYRND